jgi:hypothetical protein
MTLRWKRKSPGVYSTLDGRAEVRELQRNRWNVKVLTSSGDAQTVAKSYKKAKVEAEAIMARFDPAEAPATLPTAPVGEYAGQGPVELDSALRSVALAAAQLAEALNNFTATYRRT